MKKLIVFALILLSIGNVWAGGTAPMDTRVDRPKTEIVVDRLR